MMPSPCFIPQRTHFCFGISYRVANTSNAIYSFLYQGKTHLKATWLLGLVGMGSEKYPTLVSSYVLCQLLARVWAAQLSLLCYCFLLSEQWWEWTEMKLSLLRPLFILSPPPSRTEILVYVSQRWHFYFEGPFLTMSNFFIS